jgi:hypothetical protein
MRQISFRFSAPVFRGLERPTEPLAEIAGNTLSCKRVQKFLAAIGRISQDEGTVVFGRPTYARQGLFEGVA